MCEFASDYMSVSTVWVECVCKYDVTIACRFYVNIDVVSQA